MSQHEHDRMVADLAARLKSEQGYAIVLPNVEYWLTRWEQGGEMDVLGVGFDPVRLHYYEVKFRPEPRRRDANRKARKFFSTFGNHANRVYLVGKPFLDGNKDLEELRPEQVCKSDPELLEKIVSRGVVPAREWMKNISSIGIPNYIQKRLLRDEPGGI